MNEQVPMPNETNCCGAKGQLSLTPRFSGVARERRAPSTVLTVSSLKRAIGWLDCGVAIERFKPNEPSPRPSPIGWERENLRQSCSESCGLLCKRLALISTASPMVMLADTLVNEPSPRPSPIRLERENLRQSCSEACASISTCSLT